MNLPLTISYTNRVLDADGAISLTAVLRDSTNAVLLTVPAQFRKDALASEVIAWLGGVVRTYVENNLSAADIPLSASFEYGLPATVRPIDLIL